MRYIVTGWRRNWLAGRDLTYADLAAAAELSCSTISARCHGKSTRRRSLVRAGRSRGRASGRCSPTGCAATRPSHTMRTSISSDAGEHADSRAAMTRPSGVATLEEQRLFSPTLLPKASTSSASPRPTPCRSRPSGCGGSSPTAITARWTGSRDAPSAAANRGAVAGGRRGRHARHELRAGARSAGEPGDKDRGTISVYAGTATITT